MKFLIIIPQMDSRIGGMERFVIEISTRLSKLGHEITILAGKSKNPISIRGVKIIRKRIFFPRLFNKAIKYIHLSFYATQHLKKNNYDFVLAMGHSGIFLKDFIWRASGSPIFIIKKEKSKLKLNLLSKLYLALDLYTQKIIERCCIQKATCHMFPSIALKNYFEKEYGFAAKKSFIPCSGTFNILTNKKNKLINWKSIKNKIKLLCIGGLSQEIKGRDTILTAFSKSDISKLKIIVIGKMSGKVNETLKKEIINLEKVDYKDMPDLYQNCDILIYPSFHEGFPNVILEAASFGMAIISTKIDGIDEYFKDNEEILLINKRDVGALAEAMSKLIKDKKLRKLLGKNILKRATKFNYNKLTEEFIDFIQTEKSRNLLGV